MVRMAWATRRRERGPWARLRWPRHAFGYLAAVLLACLMGPSVARADSGLPLWELGIGAAGISLPAYPGSDEQQFFGAPFPYVVYRGKRLRADEEGVRGLFFSSERVRLEISGNGTPRVDSDEIAVREGMPDLDLSFELGPSLHVDLLSLARTQFWAELNLRALISADGLKLGHQGFVMDPALYVSTRPVPWARVGARLNVYFADAAYHDYFYQVEPAFARPGRPAYSASGGYNGSGVGLFADAQPTRHWHLRAGLTYRSVHGAVFEDSPLVVEQQGVTVFLTLARSFLRSDRRVPSKRGDELPTGTR